jgi:hypothetical protein
MTKVSVLLRIREKGKYPFVTPVWLDPTRNGAGGSGGSSRMEPSFGPGPKTR